jgi:hypothetical protein
MNRQIVIANKQKKKQPKAREPSVQALVYSGPYTLKSTKQANDTAVFQFNLGAGLQTSGAGVLATVFDPVTGVTSSPNWANISANYSEWRLLSGWLRYSPVNRYNQPTTSTLFNVYVVIDRNSATALASTSDALGYPGVEIHPLSDPFDVKWKMDGPDEATWVGTSTTPSASARQYIKFYSSGNSNSINVGEYLYTYIVQFKGLK